MMASSERSSSDLSEYTLFQSKKIFFIYKNPFLGEKWKILHFLAVFFQILSKFSDLANFVDYIGKTTSKFIRLQPVFIQKKI